MQRYGMLEYQAKYCFESERQIMHAKEWDKVQGRYVQQWYCDMELNKYIFGQRKEKKTTTTNNKFIQTNFDTKHLFIFLLEQKAFISVLIICSDDIQKHTSIAYILAMHVTPGPERHFTTSRDNWSHDSSVCRRLLKIWILCMHLDQIKIENINTNIKSDASHCYYAVAEPMI